MPIEISVPGSKSIANRALILSVLTGTPKTLKNVPICDDTQYMIEALNKVMSSKTSPIKIYTGNAGTTTRFITALATLQNKEITINGDKRMCERPIKDLTIALNKLGAKITCTKGCPPVKIKPSIPKGGSISLPGNISSQFLSALLLTAPNFTEKTTINIDQKLCSQPYINMTIKVMKTFGYKVTNNKFAQFKIEAKVSKSPENYTIESDASAASYIGAFAALNPAWTILLREIHQNSLQGDIAFLKHFKKMGCRITSTKKGTRIRGPKELKRLGTIDMNKTPDLVMTFAALAMFTPGKTTIKNIANLRIKETDRLEALENEIKKFGIEVITTKDSITIHGNPEILKTAKNIQLKHISIKTYNDHRIAMCFGILKNKFPNLKIQNPKCVNKSYSTFWKDLKTLEQAQPKPKNIILTGLRGSGKTKLGKLLAKKLKYNFIDLDDEIEKLANSTISEIVEKEGWKHFRNIETQICKNTIPLTNTVIATGGGAIINPKNKSALQKNNLIIYLQRSPKNCIKYIKNFITRPSLTEIKSQLKEMEKLYKDRDHIYKKTANIILERGDSLEKDVKIIKKHIS